MAGVDLRTVAELMGHKSIQMTMRYAHLAPAHKMAAIEKLVGAVAPETPTDSAQTPRKIKLFQRSPRERSKFFGSC